MKKKILFVEDDEPKLNQIRAFLEIYDSLLDVKVARSLNTACQAIESEEFHVILLDMSLPTFDGGKTVGASGRQKTFGGKEVLSILWELEKTPKVFVVTQFKDFPTEDGTIYIPELEQQLRRDFPALYKDYIYFEHNSDAWKNKLERLLELKEC